VIPSSRDILAVVVSFDGLDKTTRTVRALAGRVGAIHVVDNGSAEPSRRELASLEAEGVVTVSWLGENRGVGAALNVGARVARERGFTWLLTMDQDSLVGDGMIDAYVDALRMAPDLVCLTPRVAWNGKPAAEGEGAVEYAITSGNLVNLQVLEQVGLYDEALFIDCVDFEISLRLRRAGHRIHRVGAALMHHQLGEAHPIPAWLARIHSWHSPVRRYYMMRNHLYLGARYFSTFPAFIARLTLLQFAQVVTVAALGKERVASLRHMVRGVRHFLEGRVGRYDTRR
jgi:rhamnosyltransferase